jgi:hypothetical protein
MRDCSAVTWRGASEGFGYFALGRKAMLFRCEVEDATLPDTLPDLLQVLRVTKLF